MTKSSIDFVLLWVDGSDPVWLAEKAKYTPASNTDSTIYRYRDWDLLEYWFRGVEKFAPWVNNIFFITYGHLPSWLNTNHPKLKIINHKDYIPKKYLPTFNANTIENNLHRIKDLSSKFVLFNDDMYLIKKTLPTDFFLKNKPKDTIALNIHCPKKSLIGQHLCLNDVSLINEHFDFKESFSSNLKLWLNPKNGPNLSRTLILKTCPRFPGFHQPHLATSFLKSTFEEVWQKESETLDQTSSHKFRSITDVNQWLFREWQIAKGEISIRSHKFGKSFFIDRDGIHLKPQILKYIKNQKGKMISINDGPMSDTDFNALIWDLKTSFSQILPGKSSYEK